MFDDFDYTGSDDPALTAHGWSVRTESGAPGVNGATWSMDAVTFPTSPDAADGRVLRLTASTDGSAAHTVEAEVDSTARKYFEGTYAARVYLEDAPTSGPDGDDVNETFYAITPLNGCDDPKYSENDFEYLPNGGWGDAGPQMSNTTWYTYCESPSTSDNRGNSVYRSVQGWHTLLMTVSAGTVTYYVDGRKLWSSGGKYYPREPMSIEFNEWFIDGYLSKSPIGRAWDESVDWVYYAKGQALSTSAVQAQVDALRGAGVRFTDEVAAQ